MYIYIYVYDNMYVYIYIYGICITHTHTYVYIYTYTLYTHMNRNIPPGSPRRYLPISQGWPGSTTGSSAPSWLKRRSTCWRGWARNDGRSWYIYIYLYIYIFIYLFIYIFIYLYIYIFICLYCEWLSHRQLKPQALQKATVFLSKQAPVAIQALRPRKLQQGS